MSPYTKNYYHILGLASPTWRSPSPSCPSSTTTPAVSATSIRKAYRRALFTAHPDKRVERDGARRYTVDEVLEAFSVLGDERRRGEFDRWLVGRWEDGGGVMFDGGEQDGAGGGGGTRGGGREDFILGLEVLDLGDFEMRERSIVSGVSTPGSGDSEVIREEESEGESGCEWVRGCRCGAEMGFRIREGELEGARERGDEEVLVGCEGCSLWVRVGFDVESEDEDEDEDGEGG